MIGFVVRRAAIALVLLVAISFATFFLWFTIPANPARFLVDFRRATPEEIAAAERALGVDQPFLVQYGKFLSRAVRGDFGYSWSAFDPVTGRGAPVGPLLKRATGVTASLVVGGIALVLLIAIPLGSWVATRPRSFADRLVLLLSLAAISTHPLVVALLLRLFVGERWDIAPTAGYCPLFPPPPPEPIPNQPVMARPQLVCGGVADWASHLALPWLTFALFFAALYIRMMRAQMMDVLDEPFVTTARAKGASERRVISRHALRTAIAPVVTMAGMDAGMAIGIAMYVETAFLLPGLGRTTIAALAGVVGYDLPVLLGVLMVVTVVIVLLNLIADLVVLALDPRTARERA